MTEIIYKIQGNEVTREEFMANAPITELAKAAITPHNEEGSEIRRETPAVIGLKGYPIHSESMAVRPHQVKDAMEIDRKLGVPTEYDKQGRPMWTDMRHRRKFLKAHGKVGKTDYY